MNFLEQHVKGIARCLVDEDIQPDQLHLHISEMAPDTSSHPPHTHSGVEALYMLEGEGTLEIDGKQQIISAGEAVVYDPTKPHGFVNSGTSPMRYMVIIVRQT